MSAVLRSHRRCNAQQFPFELWRLSDAEYRQLRLQSFPLRIDGMILWRLARDQRHRPDRLNLAKVLLILEAEFGKSSTDLDDWKQTFSFPLLLAISKPQGMFYHLLRIEDYRGGLEFRFYRIVDDVKYSDESLDVYHEPLADEFSTDEIAYVISYLWGFLEGRASRFGTPDAEIKPFFRHVDASHIIYGYWDGQFVETVIEDLAEYQQQVQTLEAQYGEPALSETAKVDRIRAMIQEIVQG
jgi:hypothetical protein